MPDTPNAVLPPVNVEPVQVPPVIRGTELASVRMFSAVIYDHAPDTVQILLNQHDGRGRRRYTDYTTVDIPTAERAEEVLQIICVAHCVTEGLRPAPGHAGVVLLSKYTVAVCTAKEVVVADFETGEVKFTLDREDDVDEVLAGCHIYEKGFMHGRRAASLRGK